MTRELANELIATENELLQYEEIQRIEQLQQDYKEQAMNVEEFANMLRKTQNTIRDSKRELFNTRGIDIVADYHTNQEDWYKVTIEEGNGVLYVEIEYFEVTTGNVNTETRVVDWYTVTKTVKDLWWWYVEICESWHPAYWGCSKEKKSNRSIPE